MLMISLPQRQQEAKNDMGMFFEFNFSSLSKGSLRSCKKIGKLDSYKVCLSLCNPIRLLPEISLSMRTTLTISSESQRWLGRGTMFHPRPAELRLVFFFVLLYHQIEIISIYEIRYFSLV